MPKSRVSEFIRISSRRKNSWHLDSHARGIGDRNHATPVTHALRGVVERRHVLDKNSRRSRRPRSRYGRNTRHWREHSKRRRCSCRNHRIGHTLTHRERWNISHGLVVHDVRRWHSPCTRLGTDHVQCARSNPERALQHCGRHNLLAHCGSFHHDDSQIGYLSFVHGTPWTQFADAALALAVAQAWPEDSSTNAGPQSSALQIRLDLPTDIKSSKKLLVERRVALHESLRGDSAFSTLVANAALTPAEAETLALCASIDADVRRQRLTGWLQDDLALTRPGLDLLGRLLGSESSGVLTVGASSGLVRAAIVDIGTQGPWGARSVGIEPTVLWALAGEGSPDPELPAGTSFLSANESPGIAEDPLVFVTGPDKSNRRRRASDATAGTRFVVGTQPTDERGWGALVREATLRGAGIIVECDSDLSQDGRRWIERATHLPWAVSSTHEVSVNALPNRPWAEHYVAERDASPDEWARHFPELKEYVHRLTSDQMSVVAEINSNTNSGLERAVRRLASGPIDRLARRVRPRYQWADLVLDNDRSQQLKELVARYRNSQAVYGGWGFPAIPSSGLIAMFSGDPGTGKTMSAEVLAGELELDLFVVDLAAVVSKYIGETEKNLEEIFSAAAVGNQVLFFDEADSLFGKRTEVSDARDRYANLEVSYLLQRLEIFEGLAVLATNFSNNIDSAFLRRIDISIDFVQPEEPQRKELWRRSFPPNAPLADDVDPNELAALYELSGGSIRKASLYAAFLAAEAGEHIDFARISVAVDREYQKLGRLRPSKKLGR